jgi:hypothetical protein
LTPSLPSRYGVSTGLTVPEGAAPNATPQDRLRRVRAAAPTINTADDAATFRVLFAIAPPGASRVPDCFCDVKCGAGVPFTSPGALEVGRPRLQDGGEYAGAWNHHEFANVVAQYLQATQPVRVGPGARDVLMRNNLIVCKATGFIEVPATPVGRVW